MSTTELEEFASLAANLNKIREYLQKQNDKDIDLKEGLEEITKEEYLDNNIEIVDNSDDEDKDKDISDFINNDLEDKLENLD